MSKKEITEIFIMFLYKYPYTKKSTNSELLLRNNSCYDIDEIVKDFRIKCIAPEYQIGFSDYIEKQVPLFKRKLNEKSN